MFSLCVFIPALLFPLQQSTAELDELLRNRIEAAESGLAVIVGDEVVCASTALPLFYERRS